MVRKGKEEDVLSRAARFALDNSGGNFDAAVRLFKRRLRYVSRTSIPLREVTADEVRAIFIYAPETGVFTWRTTVKKGKRAGHLMRPVGYWTVAINGRQYYAHRVAWIYMTGQWPTKYIDHKNGTKDDNRWENLREVSQAQNMRNAGVWKKKSDLPKGVALVKRNARRPFIAKIKRDGKTQFLGSFATATEAGFAYQKAAQSLFGEFAREVTS